MKKMILSNGITIAQSPIDGHWISFKTLNGSEVSIHVEEDFKAPISRLTFIAWMEEQLAAANKLSNGD